MSKLLVVRKPTNLEQHQALEARHHLSRSVDDSYRHYLEKSHTEHYQSLDVLRETLTAHGYNFVEVQAGETGPKEKYEGVIAFGGDGTLITSSYYIQDNTPLIGIRSSSASVGFLCAGEDEDIPAIIEAFRKNRLRYTERHRLQARIKRRDGSTELSPISALNDFLFAAESPAATTRYVIGFLDRVETHKSSGIWIATATGSTAAIGAAGGTFMAAGDRHFQFLVRELYQKSEEGLFLHHGFSDPQTEAFWIESRVPSAILALDGEKLVIKIGFGDRISFTHASPVRVANRF